MGFFWDGHYFLPHRFLAALAAIWERFLGVKAAALAMPPLSPPSRPSANGMRVLGRVYRLGLRRIVLRSFADAFEKDLMGELIRITRAFGCHEPSMAALKHPSMG